MASRVWVYRIRESEKDNVNCFRIKHKFSRIHHAVGVIHVVKNQNM